MKAFFDGLKDDAFDFLLNHFSVTEEETVHCIIFRKPTAGAVTKGLDTSGKGNSVFELAAHLYPLTTGVCHSSEKGLQNLVHETLSHKSLTLSTLAAEIMTQRGIPSLPPKIFDTARLVVKEGETGDTPRFEDRIDVHDYSAFELVHPAYARQVVLLAGEILKRLDKHEERVRCLDVGTGLGLPLLMLLELCPQLQVTAIEPSPTSFAYLVQNFAGRPEVNPVQMDFLAHRPTEGQPLIVSVGASHHLDTFRFFQHAWSNLADDGFLMVADEFVSPFATPRERAYRLVQHHIGYLVPTLVPVPGEVLDVAEATERILVENLSTQIPLIAFEVSCGLGDAATLRCRRLMEDIAHLNLPETVSYPLLAFSRFHLLELEALLAGLDYEVERKTYPEHFVALGEAAGFSLVEHKRVYGTAGHREWDAGTHVFVFAKGGS